MISQSYRLQAFYANSWLDIEKFKDRDRAVRASKPLLEKAGYSEVRVLEISFDREKKEIVDSYPIDLDYFLQEIAAEEMDKKDGDARSGAGGTDAVIDAEIEEENEEDTQEIEKSSEVIAKKKRDMSSDFRLLLNMLSILLVVVFVIMIIEYYETGAEYLTNYICQKSSFIDCHS